MMDKEKQFLDTVKQVMDDSTRDLDGATLSKLAQARSAALDSKRQKRRKALLWSGPAAGLAAVAIVAAVMLRNGSPVAVDENYVADLDILASEESIEFYDNLEFYEWLSEIEGNVNEDDISRDRNGHAAPVAASKRAGAKRRERHAEHGNAGISRRV